jgi:hypothetical protein
MNFVSKSSACTIKGPGRPKLYTSAAAKQAAYRARKHPAEIEPGTRVIHGTHKGIVTSVHGNRFIVAFQMAEGRQWRDLPATELTFAGRVNKLPKWTDSGRPLSRNWKPQRRWVTALPLTGFEAAIDGEKIAVPVYGVRKAGRRRTRRDYTRLIDHNIAVLLERAK